LVERGGDKGMPVTVRTADGHKPLILAETARVNGKSRNRHAGRAKAGAARGGKDFA
jgi:hypothetical protein